MNKVSIEEKFQTNTAKLYDKWSKCSFDELISDIRILNDFKTDELKKLVSDLWLELAEYIYKVRIQAIYNSEVK
ncbi:MAG: hypothetical protein ACTH54_08650 [Vagococcus salmoninarum]|uniref:hypothetical protein n=1 Tax=Vagococcus salmoninarum TaxID=2739 RepID=UPI003F9603C7